MNTYQKLVGFVVNRYGGSVSWINLQCEAAGGMWDVPRPVIEVADNVVISPKADVLPDGVAFRFTEWEIFQVYPTAVRLPLIAHNQRAAVTIAREFLADPSVSFASSQDALTAWVAAYIARCATPSQKDA